MTEEGNAVGPRLVFMADAVGGGDVYAIGDRMRALDRAPGLDLRPPPFVLFRWMPADRGRIEEDLRTEQRGDPCRFGIPLVPADQHADCRVARLPHFEAVGLPG